jgi:uncharacterized protein (TIGR04255 family)
MKIDFTQQFEHLPRAPIVEAVIEIRARAEAPWEESTISRQISDRLQDYPQSTPFKEVQDEVILDPNRPVEAFRRDLGWKGVKAHSQDGRQVVRFSRDAFLFARLAPYEGWEKFLDEAKRLWAIHLHLTRPSDVQRLGLRFVNRIVLPPGDPRFEDYINPHSIPPPQLDFPFTGFLHRDSFVVPSYPYAINTVKVIEQGQDIPAGIVMLLDIDVFTLNPFELREETLTLYLAQMRYLKNKVFFGSLTEKALKNFR